MQARFQNLRVQSFCVLIILVAARRIKLEALARRLSRAPKSQAKPRDLRHLSLERAASWPLDAAASCLRVSEMCPKNQKPPICIGGSERLCAADVPPLHERTFARSLPRKRGRCREAIGMGFAHHC